MNLARQLAAYCTANPEETSKLVEVAIGYLLEQEIGRASCRERV